MKVLWHIEFTRDYRKFPYFEGVEPSLFTRHAEQCKRFELWRRRHNFNSSLSVYFSHFPGFLIPAPDPLSIFTSTSWSVDIRRSPRVKRRTP
ncbi:MAG: hypothetical protein K6E55_05240 [Thermoguttaceae bacterium]|nr:hypothetical protein [Thermoguttaceae bacterium]